MLCVSILFLSAPRIIHKCRHLRVRRLFQRDLQYLVIFFKKYGCLMSLAHHLFHRTVVEVVSVFLYYQTYSDEVCKSYKTTVQTYEVLFIHTYIAVLYSNICCVSCINHYILQNIFLDMP